MEIIDYFALFTLVLIAFLVFASTAYDIILAKSEHGTKKILVAFSLRSNWADLMKVERNSIACLHGLRGICAFWLVAGHRIMRIFEMATNPGDFDTNVVRKSYAVDVFFLMAGVLVTKTILRKFQGFELEDPKPKKSLKVFFFSGRFNLPKFYFNRYMRYMVVDAVLLLFYMSSFQESVVEGIPMKTFEKMLDDCDKFWWSNLLLVQNYVNPFNTCIPVSWFLSVDFQLFILSPFFVFLLWKFKYRALWLFAVILCITQGAIFYGRYTNTIKSMIIHRQTHFRIAQFLFGLSLGYVMTEPAEKTENEEDDKRMGFKKQILVWILTISTFAGILIAAEFSGGDQIVYAFHEATHRIAWTCLIGWVIYACHHLKSGGWLNDFLSLRAWQPFSKMSLSIYMVHYVYIMMTVANTKVLMYIQNSWMIHIIFGDFVAATILGMILYFVAEAPTSVLLKHLMK